MRYFSFFFLLISSLFGWAQQLYPISIDNEAKATMRDGVVLRADVYRPRSEGSFPVLVERTPYNRADEVREAAELAAHGYIVVCQDARGRYQSQGVFYPFLNEAADGYDTVEWAAGLKGSNGKVGMFGSSYVGATQMLAASAKPPHLAAIFPDVTASEYYNGWTYQNGALMQWFTGSWSSLLAVDTLRRQADQHLQPDVWINRLPVESYQLLTEPATIELAPYYRDWVAHETEDAYWKRWKISDSWAGMNVAALHAGGWHDIFLKGTLDNYIGMRKSSGQRDAQRLMIGPWAHAATSPEGKVGDVTFGKQAVLDMTGEILSWFDYTLKGLPNRFAGSARVRLFIMGENRWRDEDEFPLARTRYISYYLHTHSLNVDKPGSDQPEAYVYDPANPVRTLGGRLCCGDKLHPGPADQRPNEGRSDVLIYSTPPLDKDVEVTGWVKLKLFAATSAVDTDFTALLADVDDTGYARFLTDGIVRARYRNSTVKAEPVTPGQVYEYTIDLWATGNLFRAGHRIRLYVSSSNFPRFNRNLNTGEPIMGATRMVSASETIYHDAERPSALILPVIPR
jgi:putative CocE/NonD family hydrolase